MATAEHHQHGTYVLGLLHKGPEGAPTLVRRLQDKFALDEEEAGNVVWGLIDTHQVRITEEATLEKTTAS